MMEYRGGLRKTPVFQNLWFLSLTQRRKAEGK
jgi:hypothetical protein